jgi:hypothetical protein
MRRNRFSGVVIAAMLCIASGVAFLAAQKWYSAPGNKTASNLKLGEFEWTEGRVTISMPEQRKFRQNDLSLPGGQTTLYAWDAEGFPVDLSIAFADYPQTIVRTHSMDALLDLSSQLFERATNAKILERRSIVAHGYPGMEYVMNYDQRKAANYVRMQWVLVGRRVYRMDATSWKGREVLDSEPVNDFFDSFRPHVVD